MSKQARWTPVVIGALALFLAMSGGEAGAQSFDVGKLQQDGVGIGKVVLGFLMLALTIVGGGVMIQGLAEARQKGGWGHFLWGLAMVMIAFFGFISFLKLGGHNP